MRSSVYVSLTTLLFLCSISHCDIYESEDNDIPLEHYKIGPSDYFFGTNNTRDKLRLSKSFVKWSYKTPWQACSVEYNQAEELSNCADLEIENDQKELLDCRPIEEHFLDETKSIPHTLSSIEDFVRRSSVKLKVKYLLNWYGNERESRQNFYSFPLREEVVSDAIRDVLSETNITSLNFFKPLNLGYYVQTRFNLTPSLPAICSFQLIMSINRTEIFARFKNDPYPEFLDELDYWVEQGVKNGYFLSIRNGKCIQDNQMRDKSLNLDFNIVQRKEFPYLTVRHTMKLGSYGFFDLDAKIDQLKTGFILLDTRVEINSFSRFFPILNFKIDRNISTTTGDSPVVIDITNILHLFSGCMKVTSLSTEKVIHKVLTLNILKGDPFESTDTIDSLKVDYRDKKEEENVELKITLNRHHLNNLLSSVLDLFNVKDFDTDSLFEKEATNKWRDEL